MNGILPNFAVIGAAKSGTTALFQYLEQHPQVFVCEPKEPHFLAFAGKKLDFRGPYDDEIINRRAVTEFPEYQNLFVKGEGFRAIGEASVSTLYYGEAGVANIQRYIPDARLLCLLRNPVDRAYSAYNYYLSLTREPIQDFAEAWELESERIKDNYHHIWHYRQMGLYASQIQRFQEVFPPEQLRVWLYDRFRSDPSTVLRECFEYLEIDPDFVPPLEPRPLVSGRPKMAALQSVLGRPTRWKMALKGVLPKAVTSKVREVVSRRNLKKTPMKEEMRVRLIDFYREDVLRLQDLLNRDLTGWLKQ